METFLFVEKRAFTVLAFDYALAPTARNVTAWGNAQDAVGEFFEALKARNVTSEPKQLTRKLIIARLQRFGVDESF